MLIIMFSIFLTFNLLLGIALFANNPGSVRHLQPQGVVDGFITTFTFLPMIMTIMFLHTNRNVLVNHADNLGIEL